MFSQSRRILLLSLILLSLFGRGARGALADPASFTTLTAPDTSDFPHLTAHLDVHDASGAFVHGLIPTDITLLENGVQIPASELKEQSHGVQFVIAVGSGDTFTIRDGQGITRYEYLLQGMLAGAWAQQTPGVDDFSLVTMGGPALVHSPDPAAVRSQLEKYKPAGSTATPGLEVLSTALQVASDPLPQPGMERAILFIAPPQESTAALGLQSIISTAVQQNIRIYVWLLAGRDYSDLPQTELLRNLAAQTRGTFFAFSYDEPVPDLETLLEPLRYVYQLGYESQVKAAGTYQVLAQVMVGGELISSAPQSFDLNIQPPVPTLLSLPSEIVRSFPSRATPGTTFAEAGLIPVQQVIKIKVDFPDGYERPIANTSLYVDGALYAQNSAPPFDKFTWDLRPYTQDSVHTLNVEVVDNLGLTSKTGETSIQITVPTQTQDVLVVFSQKKLLVVAVVVMISASILALVLILGGRIQPRLHPGQVRNTSGGKASLLGYRERRRQLKDPVTQPVKIASVPPTQTKLALESWRDRLPWRKRKPVPPPAMAYLVPLVGSDEPTLPASLQMIADDITLGRDPLQATLVVSDPSIEAVHARIHHEGKSFVISDAGTVAGTWVNYDLVSPAGTKLTHADIIHLGAVGFRFNFAEPGQERKLVITIVEPDQ